jgi:protocatechuate 3,4-dioxygenase beta subunit
VGATGGTSAPVPPPDDAELVGVPARAGPPGRHEAGGEPPVPDLARAEHAVHRPETLADVGGAPVRMPLSNEAIVTGRVDGPGGGPVSGATITVTDFGGAQLARAVTGVDGTYRLVVPTGGTFLFICAAEHHQPAASLITVAAGELRRDVSLTGAGQIEGAVADQNGRPIAGAVLTLVDARGEVVGSAVTGPDGGYLLADLYPGEYTLTATAEGTRPAARSVVLTGTGPGRVDIVLMTNGTLAGQIRAAAADRPVPDASVMAIDQFGAVVGAIVTGADGRYEFGDLAPGVYTVTASGYAPVASRVELAGDRTDHDIVLGTPANGHRPGIHTAGGASGADRALTTDSPPADSVPADSPSPDSLPAPGIPADGPNASLQTAGVPAPGVATDRIPTDSAPTANTRATGVPDPGVAADGIQGDGAEAAQAACDWADGVAAGGAPADGVPAPRTEVAGAPADGTAVNGHGGGALSNADRDGGAR